jgi:YesN/AraC family two-component response regulator
MLTQEILEGMKMEVLNIELGYAVCKMLENTSLSKVASALGKYKFELIHDQEEILIEKIKITVIKYIRYIESHENPDPLSVYLNNKLNNNYGYLSNHFSKHQHYTLEKYCILLKIERVKELLDYKEFTLSGIAKKLKYSSIHHLSNQFKKVAGVSVSMYKKGHLKRRSIDNF